MTVQSQRSASARKTASLKRPSIGLSGSIVQCAHEQILRHIEERFCGHALAHLVGAVLAAKGFHVNTAPPGPDGGVDILASTGTLGFAGPRLCVQVKSGKHPEDVVTLRALQGAMRNFKAEQGLVVAWRGFTKAAVREARHDHFHLRLWDATELVSEIYETYSLLSAEIRAELPLERVWVLRAMA